MAAAMTCVQITCTFKLADVKLVKPLDAATPRIFEDGAAGHDHATLTLALGPTAAPYLKYVFEHVILTAQQLGTGQGSLSRLPVYASSFGMSLTVSGGGETDRAASEPSFQDISVTLAAGAQSAALPHAVQHSDQWTTATLALAGAGKGAAHVYDLDDVRATSIQDSANGRAADAPLETVTLRATRIEQVDGGVSGCWDLSANATCK